MPSTSDRRADDGSSRSSGRNGRQRRRILFLATAALTAGAVVALAAPSALAGNSSKSAGAVASAGAVQDGAKLAKSGTAKSSKSGNTSNDDVDGSAPAAKSSSPKKSAAKKSGNEPVPATESSYAENIPAYPPDGRHGRRIVYSKALMHVWIVDSKDKVVRHYPVTGRWDRPAKGVYKVYSKSSDTMNEHSMVTFQYMVRFAWGTNDTSASIGFHSIPIFYKDNPERGAKKGDRMSSKYELGLPVASGGCVRQADDDAEWLYRWSEIGDTVVVLPTAD